MKKELVHAFRSDPYEQIRSAPIPMSVSCSAVAGGGVGGWEWPTEVEQGPVTDDDVVRSEGEAGEAEQRVEGLQHDGHVWVEERSECAMTPQDAEC